MNRKISKFGLGLVVLLMAGSCVRGHERAEDQVKFLSIDGKSIELDFVNHTLRLPRSKAVPLVECSSPKHTCFYAGRDFALSFPKQCGQDLIDHAEPASFASAVIVALHNDAWVVFDRSPHLMFHYSAPVGVIGIYVPKSSDFDFRSLLRRNEVNLEAQDFEEYKIVGKRRLAACN